LDTIDVEGDPPHVLRQLCSGCPGRGRGSLWLSGYAWSRCLDDCSARACLPDRLRRWSGLHPLTGSDCDAARNNRGGGDAEPSPRDEIASGDHRPSALFSWL
jgi:hypothetical protein